MSNMKQLRMFFALCLFTAGILVFCVPAHADQSYTFDQMSGLYVGTWTDTPYGFSFYEPDVGFEDRSGSSDAIQSDAVYYQYNKSMDLFVIVYRGYQDYPPSLDGISGYVSANGCTDIERVNCNQLDAIQFVHETTNTTSLNIAFPDPDGAIMQVTVQCSNEGVRNAFGKEVFSSVAPDNYSYTPETAPPAQVNVSGPSFGVPDQSAESATPDATVQELSGLIGMNLDNAATQLGLSSPSWLWGETIYSNDNLLLASCNDSTVTHIRLTGGENYTLYGMTALSSYDTFKQVAADNGFQLTRNPMVYKVSDGLFLTYEDGSSGVTGIELRQYTIPDSTGRIDLAVYLNRSLRDVINNFPWCQLETTPEYVTWSDGIISFTAENIGENPDKMYIQSIAMSPYQDEYCLDGCVTDEDANNLGASQGGSGEYFDPYNDVLVIGLEDGLHLRARQ